MLLFLLFCIQNNKMMKLMSGRFACNFFLISLVTVLALFWPFHLGLHLCWIFKLVRFRQKHKLTHEWTGCMFNKSSYKRVSQACLNSGKRNKNTRKIRSFNTNSGRCFSAFVRAGLWNCSTSWFHDEMFLKLFFCWNFR